MHVDLNGEISEMLTENRDKIKKQTQKQMKYLNVTFNSIPPVNTSSHDMKWINVVFMLNIPDKVYPNNQFLFINSKELSSYS